jgi:hypothetical protein
MRKNPKTWLERWFWPTELAYRNRHCYAPHGAKTPYLIPAMERPQSPNRRGPRRRTSKRVRFRDAWQLRRERAQDKGMPF